MDRLRAFEIFVTVVSRGSFTRAADAPVGVRRLLHPMRRTTALLAISTTFALSPGPDQDHR